MMNQAQVEDLLKQALPHEYIEVRSPDNVHFDALIVSTLFEGHSRIARQRLVYEIIGSFMQSGEIHALALKTLTPSEWKNKD